MQFDELLNKIISTGDKLGDNIAFLIGSGISRSAPSSIPLVKEFIDALLQTLDDNVTKDLINFIMPHMKGSGSLHERLSNRSSAESEFHKLQDLRFETILRALKRTGFDPGLKILSAMNKQNAPNTFHELLTEFICEGCDVLTTNFDRMIEKCLKKHEGSEYICLKNSEEVFNYTENAGEDKKTPILAKFHGTFYENNVNNLELIADLGSIRFWPRDIWRDWTKAQNNTPGYPLMNRITAGKWLFVFGYAGRDDFDVMPMLLSSESLLGIVWIQHSDNKKIEIEAKQFFSQKEDLRIEQLYKSIRNYWLSAIASSNDVPIYVIKGDSCHILHNLAKAMSIDSVKCDDIEQVSEKEMVARIKKDMNTIYSETDEVVWGLLLGAILCEAGNHHEAVLCFSHLFETKKTEINESRISDFLDKIKEYYYETSWAWDYLYCTDTFQDKWKKVCAQKFNLKDEDEIKKKLGEIDDTEIIPPGLDTNRYHIHRCRYLQALRMGLNLLNESERKKINELHPLNDEFEYEDIRLLLHKAEHALDSGLVNKKNHTDIFDLIDNTLEKCIETGSAELVCKTLLLQGKIYKRKGSFDFAYACFERSRIWGLNIGNRFLSTEGAFEAALIDVFAGQGLEDTTSKIKWPPKPEKNQKIKEFLEYYYTTWKDSENTYGWYGGIILASLLTGAERAEYRISPDDLKRGFHEIYLKSRHRYNRFGIMTGLSLCPFNFPYERYEIAKVCLEYSMIHGFKLLECISRYYMTDDLQSFEFNLHEAQLSAKTISLVMKYAENGHGWLFEGHDYSMPGGPLIRFA